MCGIFRLGVLSIILIVLAVSYSDNESHVFGHLFPHFLVIGNLVLDSSVFHKPLVFPFDCCRCLFGGT